MGLAMGVLFIWMGAACLWVAVHGVDADKPTPWGVYQKILKGIRTG